LHALIACLETHLSSSTGEVRPLEENPLKNFSSKTDFISLNQPDGLPMAAICMVVPPALGQNPIH